MDFEDRNKRSENTLSFHGGVLGALLPFFTFLVGVAFIALSGTPDERGFWPILILSMCVGLILAKNRSEYCTATIRGMSQEIVMIMITAWMLASMIGILMTITGLVDALIWIAEQMNLSGPGFVVASFIICCTVSLSTGSSFATILICGPILYPAGGMVESNLPMLAGAILGGATFGDFIAPISDTTIASALSQKAEIGPTVKSRVKYILPVFMVSILAYYLAHPGNEEGLNTATKNLSGNPDGLLMLLVPIVIIYLFLKGKHLMHGLLIGLVFGVVLSLFAGLLPMDQLLTLDIENMTARSFIIDGINRAVGISFFTILLMGLVASLNESGVVEKVVSFARERTNSLIQAELWISGVASLAVLLITHSIVAILTVADFSNRTGTKWNIDPTRRANLLSLVVCFFPFLLPYFIPVILMANTTQTGAEYGIQTVSAFEIGMHNFVAWGLMFMTLLTLITGYGRARIIKSTPVK